MSLFGGFLGWAKGPHPFWRKVGILIGCGFVLYVSWKYLSVVVGILLILGFPIGHFMFRNSWFEGDGVRVLRFYENRPTTVDFQYMGTEMFQGLPRVGDDRPVYHTSAGQPVYVIEKDIDGVLVFAHIHDMSKLDFISKVTAFDYARETAEEAIMERDRIIAVPKLLGRDYAKAPIKAVITDTVAETVTLTPGDAYVATFLKEAERRQNPYQAIREKYLKEEEKAQYDRIVELLNLDQGTQEEHHEDDQTVE